MKKWPNPRDANRRKGNGVAPLLGHFGIRSVDQIKPMGSVEEYAEATGRQVVYYDNANDQYIDKDGLVVQYDPDTMVRIQLNRRGDGSQ